ncbi:MAG: GNAT family N-acetyltransferase [Pseudomonadota bacterium]
MSLSALEQMFKPNSVVVIGETHKDGTTANLILQNLLDGTFLGPVLSVNEDGEGAAGLPGYTAIDTLPLTPDLAIICLEPDDVPTCIDEIGKRGTRAALVLSRGFSRFNAQRSEAQRQAVLQAAKRHGVRVLGPESLGFLSPSIGINASLISCKPLAGKVAFVSQSEALFTTVLDWAQSRKIGFSHCISLGNHYDLSFPDILDYLDRDGGTRAVLLYVENIEVARHFMSAARALARNKPLLVIKSGRSQEGAAAAAAHTGMPLGADDVYDAAFRRAGMLRVPDIDTIFNAVEALALAKPLRGNRLAILSNGGSPAFLATDTLLCAGGQLAELSEETCQNIDNTFGAEWSYWNPLVVSNTASPAMYENALKILLADKGVDAVLVLYVPTPNLNNQNATANTDEASLAMAEAVIKATKRTKKTVLTSWLGEEKAQKARQFFASKGMPTFMTPSNAVNAFLNLAEFRHNQELLMETPPSMPESFNPDARKARTIVNEALEKTRQILTPSEAHNVLRAYEIPVAETIHFENPHDVVEAAKRIGYPVAVKVISPDVPRVSLVGGVMLDVQSDEKALSAVIQTAARLKAQMPDARITGYTVQSMCHIGNAIELAVEAATDPVFGPVIRLGRGGILAGPRTAALPPLNMGLAHELMRRAGISSHGTASYDAASLSIGGEEGMQAVALLLVKVSQLLIDIPEIFEIDIDPIFVNGKGLVALDAQMRIAWSNDSGTEQLAIRPYPRELEERITLRNGLEIHIRPIRPEDEPSHWEFLEKLSADDKRFRFFGNVAQLPRAEMVKLTQIDYDREMAFIATTSLQGREQTLGSVRAMATPDNSEAEFAVTVRSDLKRFGLGQLLMRKIIDYCRARGTKRIVGSALGDNKPMAELARNVGFVVSMDYDEDVWQLDLPLD